MIKEIDDRLQFLWHHVLGSARFEHRFLSVDEANAELAEKDYAPLSDDEIKWWFDTAPIFEQRRVTGALDTEVPYFLANKTRENLIQSFVFFGLSQAKPVVFSVGEIEFLLSRFGIRIKLTEDDVIAYGLQSNIKSFFRNNLLGLWDFLNDLADAHFNVVSLPDYSTLSPAKLRIVLIRFVTDYHSYIDGYIKEPAFINKHLKIFGQSPLSVPETFKYCYPAVSMTIPNPS